MSTVTPMVEYLLALEKPGGGKLTRFGGVTVTLPVWPPGLSITFTLTPYFNTFASIEYWHRFSPSIVPGAFNFASSHRGIQVQLGILGTVHTSESHNTWIEITEAEPIVTTIINVSGVNQFFENTESFLIVDSEDDFKAIREVVRNWGAFESVATELRETNQLLREVGLRISSPVGGR